MKILIIEDDSTLNKNINDALQAEGYLTQTVYDGLLADKLLKKEAFDCVILDINLPGKNGYDICTDFRKINAHTPVVMLTAFSELEDKVMGYHAGADDYLTKPFYMRELLLKVNTMLKRNSKSETKKTLLTYGDLSINHATKKVTRQNQEIILTPREYQILVKLTENNGELVSKLELVQEIWGAGVDANTNTVEVYINFLRNKVDKPFGKNSIKTKVGYGYYFENTDGD